MDLNEFKAKIQKYENIDLRTGVTDAQINQAEEILKIRFSHQYRMFLSVFGCGGIESEDFIGLGGPPHLNITEVARRLRSRNNSLENHLIPIRADGCGNYDCIDTSRSNLENENPIVFWRHDIPDKIEIIAESFNEWLGTVLNLIEEDL